MTDDITENTPSKPAKMYRADWLCPDCGVGKMDFEMIEIN